MLALEVSIQTRFESGHEVNLPLQMRLACITLKNTTNDLRTWLETSYHLRLHRFHA